MNNIRITTFLSLLLTVTAVECAFGQVKRMEPTGMKTDELLKLCSVALSEKSGHKSFLLTADMRMDDAFSYRIAVGWKAPDQALLLMLDPRDNTPLLFTMADRTYVYDPAKMVFHSDEGSGVKCEVKMEGDNLKFQFQAPCDPQVIDVDLGSILRKATRDVKITGDKKGLKYRFIGSTEKGNRSHAVIIPNSAIPLQKLELFLGKDVRPKISLTLSAGGAGIDDGFFDFPTDDLKKLKIPIMPVRDNIMAAGLAVGMGVMARDAMENPGLRKDNKIMSHLEVDWVELGKKDAAVSKALREVFATQIKAIATQIKGSEIQQEGADQPATAPESKLEGGEKLKPKAEVRSR